MQKLNFIRENPRFSKHYLLIPIILIVFYFLFFFFYQDVKDRTIDEFNNEQLILAQTAAQGITSFINDYQADLTFISKLKNIIDFDDEGKALMANFYEKHKNLMSAFTMVDAHGRILYTYPINESVIGNDISNQKHVSQVIATQKPVLSDVFMAVQGYPAIALHVPVFKGNEYKGSLAMLIPIDKLGERYLGKIKIRGTGNVWLLSENGIEIYCPVAGHEGNFYVDITNNDTSATSLLEKIRTREYGSGNSIHQQELIDGNLQFIKKYMTFYRAKLSNTYWTILISYQEKDIYTALTKLRNRLIFVFLLLFLVVLYYFYSLSKVRTVLSEESKRKKAEKILRDNEEKFRTIFEESPIGIELYDKTGKQINANKASLDMFGIPDMSEIQNFNIFDGTSLDAEKKEKLRKGEPIVYQAKFDFERVKELKQYKTIKTGKSYFDYTVTPLLNSVNRSIDGYLVHVQDISERKHAEEEILMLAHSLKSVNECVSITDEENRILFVNKAFLNTYGYEEDELTGKTIDFLRAAENYPGIYEEISQATINGGWKGELKNRRKDGTVFPIYLSTNVIKDKNGKQVGMIGVASDITIRKHNEEELVNAKERAEESDRLKSAFLANMSHEIRTPMNGILGFADLLKEPDLTGEQQQKYIGIIEKSGERMLNIINDLVNISKIEAGQMEIYITSTNINEQMDFIYAFFRPEVEKKGLQFSLRNSLPAREVNVYTDREKIYAILTNLVKNAIKYTKEGYIEFGYMPDFITALSTENEDIPDNSSKNLNLRFYIRDSGIGIPNDRLDAIFERFVQADIEDRNAMQGAGLGLAITKAYVQMLGGKIWVESEEGEGSVFYFTIPFKSVPDKIPSGIMHIPVSANGNDSQTESSKLKVLIAEDDESSEIFVETLVKMFTNDILKARTGADAVEICRQNPDIDLVLMDIQMPDMNGYEATRKIRRFNNEIIIIAQTAYAILGDREKAIAAGCNDYITKPIKRLAFNDLMNRYFSS
jgi:PAS domain S-box-containing protein